MVQVAPPWHEASPLAPTVSVQLDMLPQLSWLLSPAWKVQLAPAPQERFELFPALRSQCVPSAQEALQLLPHMPEQLALAAQVRLHESVEEVQLPLEKSQVAPAVQLQFLPTQEGGAPLPQPAMARARATTTTAFIRIGLILHSRNGG